MASVDFVEAFKQVRCQYSDKAWFSLSVHEISKAIYAQLESLDLSYSRRAYQSDFDLRNMAAE